MDKTLIVGSPNINGNVGSCEIKSQEYRTDFWHYQTTALNSCTGEIIAQNTYIGGFSIFTAIFFVAIGLFLIILAIGGAIGILSGRDNK